ncbi:MAG: bifunctional riboflavin kinase/FAD synthetase [Caulobacteraceae bacterium]
MALHVLHGWKNLEADHRGASLALGNFDGVHRGHLQVIANAAKAAGALQVPLGVISFEPHTHKWFYPNDPAFRLTNTDQQRRLLEGLGVDRLHVLPFDAEIAGFGDEEFARRVLADGLGARHVAAGFDITFGKGRTGHPDSLTRYGEKYGFSVSIARPVTGPSGLKFSSTDVRAALRAGRPEDAAAILGRPFTIEGVVVHGDQLGRTIGFPTANIALEDYVRPAYGIYAARTRLADGREAPGVAYIGKRPTILNDEEERLEVYLFDFDEDLYGHTLEVELVRFIRGDEKFDGLDALVEQMGKDAAVARALLVPEI